jgi:hypothetical protein
MSGVNVSEHPEDGVSFKLGQAHRLLTSPHWTAGGLVSSRPILCAFSRTRSRIQSPTICAVARDGRPEIWTVTVWLPSVSCRCDDLRSIAVSVIVLTFAL